MAPLTAPGAQRPCPQLWEPRCPAQCVAQLVTSVQHLMAPGSASDPEVCGREMVPEQLSQPGGEWGALTFGLAVLEGGPALVLGEQPPSAGEAAGAPRLRLVRAHGAGLAGPEAIGGEGAGRALAWKTEAMAFEQPCPQPSSAPGKGTKHHGWGGAWGRKPGVPEPASHPSVALEAQGRVAWPGLAPPHQQEEKWPCAEPGVCVGPTVEVGSGEVTPFRGTVPCGQATPGLTAGPGLFAQG